VRSLTARYGRDRGAFAALELTIQVPFIIVMTLLVVAFGRVSRSHQLVDQAAQAAARSGSLAADPQAASKVANDIAAQTLADGGVSCTVMHVDVNTLDFQPGGQIVVTVSCQADLSDLTFSGVPGSVTLTASSTSPLETYRQFGAG